MDFKKKNIVVVGAGDFAGHSLFTTKKKTGRKKPF